MNLCVNARDAIEKQGHVWITLEKDHHFISLTVKDDGSGIPPDVLPRIFEALFTTKPVGKGTGLGLSVVSTILKNNNSAISVASEVGVGTTFDLRIPVA